MHQQLAAMPLPARTLVWSPDGVTLFQATGTLVTMYDVLARNAGADESERELHDLRRTGGRVAPIVQPPQDQTATWTGATVDNGASTALGGTATQQVTALTGITGFVGKIRSIRRTARRGRT